MSRRDFINILILSPKIPHPPDSGAKIVTFNTIKYLALRGHRITLFALSDEGIESEELRRYCHIETAVKDTRSSLIGAFINMFSNEPYNMKKYRSNNIKKSIISIFEREQFDVVHVELLHMAHYGVLLKRRYGVPAILRQHNVESIILERYMKNCTNHFMRKFLKIQYRRLLKYEASICQEFDRVIAITNDDRNVIKKMNPEISVVTILPGVDLKEQSYDGSEEIDVGMVFTGTMDWYPNREGVMWFVRDVFPLIKKECPEIRFYIVGKNPPKDILKLAGNNIIVTGYVDDPGNYIKKGRVCVVPLLTGSGIRLKILEALAMKKAVVSTSIGCEGIGLEDGRHILIADESENFAKKVIELIRSKRKRQGLEEEGYRFVLENFCWTKIAADFEKSYAEILKRT